MNNKAKQKTRGERFNVPDAEIKNRTKKKHKTEIEAKTNKAIVQALRTTPYEDVKQGKHDHTTYKYVGPHIYHTLKDKDEEPIIEAKIQPQTDNQNPNYMDANTKRFHKFIETNTLPETSKNILHHIWNTIQNEPQSSLIKFTASKAGSIYIKSNDKTIRIAEVNGPSMHMNPDQYFKTTNEYLTILVNKKSYKVITPILFNSIAKNCFPDIELIGGNEKKKFAKKVRAITSIPLEDGFNPITEALLGFFDTPGLPSTTPLPKL